MKAFIDPFDAKFGFTSHLKALRAFVVAGGAPKRRHILTEFAVSLSSVDFADTRWLGLVKVLLYLTDMQTPAELARAIEALEFSADEGDDSAASALTDPGEPQMHINAIYEFVENIVENEGA